MKKSIIIIVLTGIISIISGNMNNGYCLMPDSDSTKTISKTFDSNTKVTDLKFSVPEYSFVKIYAEDEKKSSESVIVECEMYEGEYLIHYKLPPDTEIDTNKYVIRIYSLTGEKLILSDETD